jgi:predicted N-acetyltransferase YhbS
MASRGPGHDDCAVIKIRRETPADHRAVENLTREAFWGSEGPRCNEHLLVHRLRDADSFVPELDLVAEADGVVVGHVVYTRAQVVGADAAWDVLTFGPLSVLPACQGTGVGGALMRHSLAEAARLGHRAVVVYGHPDYYPRFGFVRGADVGITGPGGATFDALMAVALVDGGLDGVRGEFREDPVFHDLDPDDVAAFDSGFPPKEPATMTPLDALEGHVPPQVLAALRSAGYPDLESVRRQSSAEVAALDGVGEVGCDALRGWLRERGIPWGAAAA